MVDINRNRDADSVKERGRMPARKEATAMTTLRLSKVKRPSIMAATGRGEGQLLAKVVIKESLYRHVFCEL